VRIEEFLADTDVYVEMNPAPGSTNPFTRAMTARVENVSIASLSAEAAISKLCETAGLHGEIVPRAVGAGDAASASVEWHLRVLAVLESEADETEETSRIMGAPLVLRMNRDAPFTDYSELTPADIAHRNEARSAQLAYDERIVNAPIFVAGPKDFECALLLRPGWKPKAFLDDIGSDAAAQEAAEHWEDQFGTDIEARDEDTGDPVSVHHAKHPLFGEADNADVGRLWIFPDDLSYLSADARSSPYARTRGPWADAALFAPYLNWSPTWTDLAQLIYAHPTLGGNVPAEETSEWAVRRRPFGDTVGRRLLSIGDRKPIVWLNFHATAAETALTDPNWLAYSGQVKFDETRAALWLNEDNLRMSKALRLDAHDAETNALNAYVGIDFETGTFSAPHFFVAITCTVRGDRRLRYHAPSVGSTLLRRRSKVIDLGAEQFMVRKKLAGQINAQLSTVMRPDEEDPRYWERDDATALARYADAETTRMVRSAVAGTFEAPYLKTDVRLGDSFDGVPGIGLSFPRYPQVHAIEWVKDPKAGFRTVYHLTDLRHSPEVGSE